VKAIYLYALFLAAVIAAGIVLRFSHRSQPQPDELVQSPAEMARAQAHPPHTLRDGLHPPFVHHVIIISIDGCRPDLLLRADTPFIHSLLGRSSFTFYAQTTDVAITLPSHVSMLTGVKPETHGIDFNTDPAPGRYPNVPTILELAHAAGMTTGVFSTKSKFSVFTRPHTIDYVWISEEATSPDDDVCAAKAAAAIRQHRPGVMLVHLGGGDYVGHVSGWGSDEQFEALHKADACVAEVFAAIHDAGMDDDTLTIITADHGGGGTGHGPDNEPSHFIPWIATGPQVKKHFDLTNFRELPVLTEDTFATACYFLGLDLPDNIDGQPVYAIIPSAETEPASPTTGPVPD